MHHNTLICYGLLIETHPWVTVCKDSNDLILHTFLPLTCPSVYKHGWRITVCSYLSTSTVTIILIPIRVFNTHSTSHWPAWTLEVLWTCEQLHHHHNHSPSVPVTTYHMFSIVYDNFVFSSIYGKSLVCDLVMSCDVPFHVLFLLLASMHRRKVQKASLQWSNSELWRYYLPTFSEKSFPMSSRFDD